MNRPDEIEGTFELEDGTEVAALLRYSVTPYLPAITAGPIELCRPAEGGVEVEELLIAGAPVDHTDPRYADLVDELTDRAWEYSRARDEHEDDEDLERDYGGAFDGSRVTSDADSGL